MNNIFMPKEIVVGFQERSDTYTGKLAYVIYKNEKGVLMKKDSWNTWRSSDIEPLNLDNTPTSGFVLNKKAGGYSTGWNHRQTYTRVYDPRGFEFEITIDNLLYILENTSSIKGKGLEGEFVYGWSGKNLMLIPTSSPDYKEICEFNKLIFESKKIKAKDLKIGATYLTKQNDNWVYLGRYNYYDTYSEYRDENMSTYADTISKLKGKRYFFAVRGTNYFTKEPTIYFEHITSISNKIIDVVDENCALDYSEIFEELEGREEYSPIDYSKTQYIEYTQDELEERFEDEYNTLLCYVKHDDCENRYVKIEYISKYEGVGFNRCIVGKKLTVHNDRYCYGGFKTFGEFDTVEELLKVFKPKKRVIFLENGRQYRY